LSGTGGRQITFGRPLGTTISESPRIGSHWSADNVLYLENDVSKVYITPFGRIGFGSGSIDFATGQIEGESVVNINASAISAGPGIGSNRAGLEIFHTDPSDDFLVCKDSSGDYIFNLNGDGKIAIGFAGNAKNSLDIKGLGGVDTVEFSAESDLNATREICRYDGRDFRSVEVFLTVTDGDGRSFTDEHLCTTVNMIHTGHTGSTGHVHHSEYGRVTAKAAVSPYPLTNGFTINSRKDSNDMVLEITINGSGDTFIGRAMIKTIRIGGL
jgi:hypothetical protein